MNLKHTIFVSSLFFLWFSSAALAQQATKADIQVLEAKMNALQTTMTEMDKRLISLVVIPRRMSSRALRTLSLLRAYRVRADYELDVQISEQDVRDAVNRLEAYIHECRRILGVI